MVVSVKPGLQIHVPGRVRDGAGPWRAGAGGIGIKGHLRRTRYPHAYEVLLIHRELASLVEEGPEVLGPGSYLGALMIRQKKRNAHAKENSAGGDDDQELDEAETSGSLAGHGTVSPHDRCEMARASPATVYCFASACGSGKSSSEATLLAGVSSSTFTSLTLSSTRMRQVGWPATRLVSL